jgi:hypothetical protein
MKMEDYMTPESIERSDKIYQKLLKKQNKKIIKILEKWFNKDMRTCVDMDSDQHNYQG